jgi:Nuclease-related domain
LGTSSLDWALGFFFGAAVGVLAWVWDAPPAYIENWRRGAEGERRTARALRDLEPDGWYVRHDVLAERGNRDHIVVGTDGVYLLDTKVLAGVVRVGGDVVAVERLEDPRGPYRLDRLAPALRAEAARLEADLESTACRTWVQAVVVVWGAFPQRVVEGDRLVVVHGNELAAWLRGRPATRPDEKTARLTDAVRGLRAAA